MSLDIVTVPTADTPGTAAVLRVGAKRYVLGQVAEGLQRALMEQGQGRLTALGALFITGRTEWRAIGGLFGMILSMADATAFAEDARVEELKRKAETAEKGLARTHEQGARAVEKAEKSLEAAVRKGKADEVHSAKQKLREAKSKQQEQIDRAIGKIERLKKDKGEVERTTVDVFGSKNITHAVATARRFVFRQGLPLYVHEVVQGHTPEGPEIAPTWQDESVRVWAIPFGPKAAASEQPGKRMWKPIRTISRKRKIGEVNGEPAQPADTIAAGAEPSQQELDDIVRAGVVADMFRSSWSLDQLVEQKLSEARLPATLFVRKQAGAGLEEYKGPLPGQPNFEDIKVWIRKPWPGALIKELPQTIPSSDTASYIVLGYPPPPKIDKKKMSSYKIQPAQMKDLMNGLTIRDGNGCEVTLEMITAEPEPAKGVAVVELPTEEYVQSLLDRPEWDLPEVKAGLVTILWILGPGVAQSQALAEFMRQRGSVHHIVSSEDNSANLLTMDSAARSTVRLSKIDPIRFQVPLHDELPTQTSKHIANGVETAPATFRAAQMGLTVDYSPKFIVKNERQDALAKTDKSETLSLSDDVQRLVNQAQDDIANDKEGLEQWRSSIPYPDADIITLGTGSALPSKYRNVSSTLLRVPGVGSYLFDAGENTLGQLKRVFKPEELDEIFQDLRMIWISHLHADHHLGTASVIRAWRDVVHPSSAQGTAAQPVIQSVGDLTEENVQAARRLAVVSDTGMLNWLAEYSQVEDFGYGHLIPLYIFDSRGNSPSRLFLRFGVPQENSNGASTASEQSIVPPGLYPALLGLSDIQSVHVTHCHGAKAVSITFEGGFKVSYSGDCRPSKEFARIGHGSTVLIHEATFDDELLGEAKAKAHSTTGEALRIGAAMRARAVVLTHFSQRYQKIPVMGGWEDGIDGGEEERGKKGKGNVGRGGVEGQTSMEEESIMRAAMMDIAEDLPHAAIKYGGLAGSDGVRNARVQEEPTSARSRPDRDLQANGTDSSSVAPEDTEAAPTPVLTSIDETAKARDAETTPASTIPTAEATAPVRTRISDMQICVAFDYMRIRAGAIAEMKHLTPPLVTMFEEREREKEQEKAENKAKARKMEEEKVERRERNVREQREKVERDRARKEVERERRREGVRLKEQVEGLERERRLVGKEREGVAEEMRVMDFEGEREKLGEMRAEVERELEELQEEDK